jgi:vacuolar-type H+-ATPase subunit H
MEKILEEVLAVEKNVDKIIQDARRKAQEIRQNAENEISDKLTDARQQAQKRIHDSAGQAREDAGKIREGRLKGAEDSSNEFLEKNKDKIEKFIKEITRQIITTGYEKG